jgi:hypothetical protein
LDQDLLGLEAFLVAFAGGQSLLIFLDFDFHATAAPVTAPKVVPRS